MEPLHSAGGNQGEDEVDGETRVVEFSSTDALRRHFLQGGRNTREQSVRRILGFPDPPPPAKSVWERLARYFGVDADQAELKVWRIRHALALQGYLKQEYVPQLRDYETDEVDTVCFRWKTKTTPDQGRINLDPTHSTGRSFEYRELCRPNPPAKNHVWVMLWESLERLGQKVNIWRHNRAVQVRAFGDNVADHFQALVEDIRSRDVADGGAAEDDAIEPEPEELTFFDSRSYPRSFSTAEDGDDETDGPSHAPSSAHVLRKVTDERAAARDSGLARRGHRNIEQDKPLQQSDRSKTSFGLISFLLGRRYKSGTIETATADKLSDVYSYRPYFTYWASTVHILVLIITLATYGFAPVGVGNKVETSSIADVTGGSVIVEREIERNFWFGPTFTNLIHLGAKYGPCMRKDDRIFTEITRERGFERDMTACCVRTDSQICFQSTQSQCTQNFFRWLKWNGNSSVAFTGSTTFPVPTYSTPSLVSQANPATCINNGTSCFRTSGTVCGQDPTSCVRPASVAPREWPDDISRWPVCAEVDSVLNVTSTSCEVTGRPCCVGKQGVCTIATEAHCNYVNGFYHANRRLCSEVNCLEDICGLTSFLNRDTPDQFYRLWTSLCMHVGIIHLLLTLIVHMTIGRHIEKLIGWFRMGMIYVLSGIGGNLVSAVFVPYQAEWKAAYHSLLCYEEGERSSNTVYNTLPGRLLQCVKWLVGPGGALFGLLATLYIEIIQQWRTLETPGEELFKVSAIVIFLFVLGLLPYVDNFANISGFIFGLLLAAIFVPFLRVQPNTRTALSSEEAPETDFRRKKIIMIAVATPLVVVLFTVLCIVFWVVQDWNCSWCRYINCVPLTSTICQDLSQDIRQPRFVYNLAQSFN